MSLWVFHEVIAAGGVDTTEGTEDADGHFRATYRGHRLHWYEYGMRLRAAAVEGFDRWANSTHADGPAPATLADLNALLDDIDAARAAHGDDTDRWPDEVFDHLFPELTP